MAISLVAGGNLADVVAGSVGDVPFTLPTLAQDDYVYIAIRTTGVGSGLSAPSEGGYSQVATSGGSTALYRKKMGATPDTTVTIPGSGTGTVTGGALVCLRGVDTTAPEDAAVVVTTGSSTNPDAGSITTVTDNAWVIDFAVSDVNDAAITAPTGYSNLANDAVAAGSAVLSVAVATKTKTPAGAENPGAYGSWSTGSWKTFTVAVRPAGTAINVALTGQSMTASRGSVSPTASKTPTGQALTAARGTVVPTASKDISGQAASTALGTAVGTIAKTPTGQSLSAARGTVAVADRSFDLAGQQAAVVQDTLTAEYIREMTGTALPVSQGTLSPTASAALAGEQTEVDLGSFVDPGGVTDTLTGTSTSFAQGSLDKEVTVALSGLSIASSQGTFTLGSTTALSGQALASVINIAQGVTFALDAPLVSGQELSTGLGTLVPAVSTGVTGTTMTTVTGRAVGTFAMDVSGHQLSLADGDVMYRSFSVAPSPNKAVVDPVLNRVAIDATLNRVAVDAALNEADVP